MFDTLTEALEELSELSIVTEEYSDVSLFIEDPQSYLESSYWDMRFKNPEALFTEDLKTDGKVYTSVISACNELVKVNAYTEALAIYAKFIEIIEELIKTSSKEDKDNLEWSMNELKSSLLKVMKSRDDYTSKRKAVLAKYSDLIKKIG